MKAILIILLCALTFTAGAQTAMTVTGGSLTNTDTGYVGSTIPGGYGVLSIQLIVTKTSGTVAGTAWLQGSNDGTNYANVSTDTLALANVATNTKLWNVGVSPYLYYRAYVVTSGTQVSVPSGYYVFRKIP